MPRDLTTEEMGTIINDLLLGRDSKLKGPEVDEFIERIKPDIALAKKNKWVVEVPKEWP